MNHIQNKLTNEDVTVSIDGAHIKTKDILHFDIWQFLNDNGCTKIEGEADRWQGKYQISGCSGHIIITSEAGIGDVSVRLLDGKQLYVESKKSKENKSGREYPLMREAIGQLMTGRELTEQIIPAVAVPYSDKTNELAARWSGYSQIKKLGIRFILVKADGNIVMI